MRRAMAVAIWAWAALGSCAWVWSVVNYPELVIELGAPAILFLIVGSLLVTKDRGKFVGPTLLIGGSTWVIYDTATVYATVSDQLGPFPLEHLSAWLGTWTGAIAFVMVPTLLVIFPDGRFTSGRRWFVIVLGAELVSLAIGATLMWPQPTRVLIDSELADSLPAYAWIDIVYQASALLIVPALVSMAIRYHRSAPLEKLQTRWFLTGALVAPVVAFMIIRFVTNDVLDIWVVAAAVSVLPISIGIAVLRYRLYDIDRIISRTVTYAVVVAVLAGVVALVATLVSVRFESPLVVAATTLGVAAAFNPLRRRVQKWVDRRFDRSRYDAERVMDEFARSLRDQLDEEAVLQGWQGVVSETMHPSYVGVWVRGA